MQLFLVTQELSSYLYLLHEIFLNDYNIFFLKKTLHNLSSFLNICFFFSSNLSWNDHIVSLTKEASKILEF